MVLSCRIAALSSVGREISIRHCRNEVIGTGNINTTSDLENYIFIILYSSFMITFAINLFRLLKGNDQTFERAGLKTPFLSRGSLGPRF